MKKSTHKRQAAPLIMPQSITPDYQPRDVTADNRETLRGGCYFVQTNASEPFRIARFTRGKGFWQHETQVFPLRVFTCSADDAKGVYCGQPIANLQAATSGDPALRPYL
jgi:hypothetical protein